METGSTLTVKFPKTHKLPDGAEGVLRQGDLVELPVYDHDASIDERRYELTECMISGTVEREVFSDHRETPEYKVFAGLAVRLVGRHRKVLATTHTGGSGQFSLPIPDERPLFLRFEPEYREDGQIWTLPAHERQVEPSAGFPFPIVGTVRYELKRAVITGLVTGSGSVGLKDVPVVVVQNGLPQKTVTTAPRWHLPDRAGHPRAGQPGLPLQLPRRRQAATGSWKTRNRGPSRSSSARARSSRRPR